MRYGCVRNILASLGKPCGLVPFPIRIFCQKPRRFGTAEVRDGVSWPRFPKENGGDGILFSFSLRDDHLIFPNLSTNSLQLLGMESDEDIGIHKGLLEAAERQSFRILEMAKAAALIFCSILVCSKDRIAKVSYYRSPNYFGEYRLQGSRKQSKGNIGVFL